MDPILALIVIEQTIATVVIATAIVIYSRATTRILESHVEPEVHVTIEGGPDSNLLTITNNAGCAVSNLNVIVSAGCVWGSQPYPPRHCLYFGAWELIAAGSTQRASEQPVRLDSLVSVKLPQGARIDTNDISVEYSFTRRADKRRYSFKYQVGVYQQADDKLVYVRMEEPKLLSNNRCVADASTDAAAPKAPLSLARTDASSSLGAAAPCIG